MNRRGFIAGTFALLGAWKLKLPWTPAAQPLVQIPPAPEIMFGTPGPGGEWSWRTLQFVLSLTKSPDGATIIESKWVENGKTLPPPELESASFVHDTTAQEIVAFRGLGQGTQTWLWSPKALPPPKTDGVA